MSCAAFSIKIRIMKNLLRAAFLLLFLGIHPVGCEKCNDTCCGSDFSNIPEFVSIQEMKFENVTAQMDSSFLASHQSYEDYEFSVTVTRTKDIAETNVPSLHFGYSLWACSPPIPKVQNPIASVDFIAENPLAHYNEFIDSIAAEDTINAIFRLDERYFSSTPFEYYPVDSFATIYRNFDEGISHYIYIGEENRDSVDLSFRVDIELTDGTEFTFPNQTLKLLPH